MFQRISLIATATVASFIVDTYLLTLVSMRQALIYICNELFVEQTVSISARNLMLIFDSKKTGSVNNKRQAGEAVLVDVWKGIPEHV